ncbi:MAG TPA: LytTR family DNA-binding domain-containing protein [Gemmatimonadaceae bacterium]|nr:LytTR family DNA-binding domain-containing protein [Gemmatimonadaceae bacterium]
MKFTACIVDDEPLAGEGLAALLSRDPEIEVIDVCDSGKNAVEAILDSSPDIVFLDVQMPGMNGFDVIREIGVANMPAVVFTTAYDKYALDAFEANAIEYLLKPFSDERLAEAVVRAKRSIRERKMAKLGENLVGLMDRIGSPDADKTSIAGSVARITIRTADKTYFIPTAEIDWIEGADYYASVHSRGKTHLLRETLTSLSNRLDGRAFMRVHKSAIVNVSRVKEIQSMFNREAVAVLIDGTKVRLARGKRAQLEALIEGR